MSAQRYCLVFGISIGIVTTAWGQPAPQATTTTVTPTHSATVPLIQHQPGHARALAPTDTYNRVICVVPLVGTGKRQDPIRPDLIPVHKPGDTYHSGIIAWMQVPTDDGKHAIVEIVATSRAALQPILTDKRADVVVFEPARHKKAEMEAGLQKFKKDFSLDKFPRAVAQ